MGATMMALAMLLAVEGPGQVPTDPRLEAFRASCVPHRDDYAAAAALLERDGWDPVEDDHHPELFAIMAKSREAMDDPELNATSSVSVWTRDLDGRRYHVVLTRMDAVLREEADDDGDGVIQSWEEKDVFSSIGCNFYELDATEGVPDAAVTAWVGAEPVQSIDHEGMSGGTWGVYDLMPGTGEVHVGFIREDSTSEDKYFSGVAITMSSAPKEAQAQYLIDKARWEAEDAARAQREAEIGPDDWGD